MSSLFVLIEMTITIDISDSIITRIYQIIYGVWCIVYSVLSTPITKTLV